MTDYPRTPRINLPLVPDGDTTWGPAMRQAMTDLDAAVPWKARRHALATTPSLAYFATANLEIQLTESCELISTMVDRECWVRIYGSAEARTRDAARQPDTPAPKGRGLYGQTHPYPPDDLTTEWSSAPFFHNLDPTIATTAYIAVTNMTVGYEGPINLDFEFLPQEQFTPSAPPGDPGPPGRSLIIVTAPPTSIQGQEGDSAFDKIAKVFYGPKSGGAWPTGVSLVGLSGIDGKQLRSGPADPTATDGVDGEFFINYTTWKVFGPKAGGTWPAGVSLVGPPGSNGTNGANGTNGLDGKTIIYLNRDPTGADGNDGDSCINTTTHYLFGPKASGAWPAGTSLVGPAGGTDTFSTTETATNKVWINGKIIYRKVVDFGALPNTTTKNVAHGITGITRVTACQGTAVNGSGVTLPLSQGWPTSTGGVALYCDGTNVIVVTGSNLSAYATTHVVIEYTK